MEKTKAYRLIFRCFVLLVVILCYLIIGQSSRRAVLKLPASSQLFLDRHGQFLSQVSRSQGYGYGYWPINKPAKRVEKAILALEDRRFWTHNGVDAPSIVRAIWHNLYTQKRQGASTIVMQIARMQQPESRTYWYKVIEMATALWLDARYSKKELLAHYLTIVPYGNQYHGVAYAARSYFSKPAVDLSWSEIAILSAIPKAPGAMNLYRESGLKKAKKRAEKLLDRLLATGVMPGDYFLASKQALAAMTIRPKKKRPLLAMHAILYLQNKYKDSVDKIIKTTLDLSLQESLIRQVSPIFKRWQQKGVSQFALLLISKTDREVLCWLGSAGYKTRQGAIDYNRVKRSSGSTLKPFIYAQALQQQVISVDSILLDNVLGAGGIRNADGLYLGAMLPRQALANSRNVPAINILKQLGIEKNYLFMGDAALHDYAHNADYYGLGLAIGTLAVTLENLVQAYAMLANDGEMKPLVWSKGEHKGKQLLPASISRLITLFLADPMARLPTFPRANNLEFQFPVAIKTGTSQGYRDAWNVAWSKQYMLGLWAGRGDYRMTHKFAGVSSSEMTQKVFKLLHKDKKTGLADNEFAAPKEYKRLRLCLKTGALYRQQCQSTGLEWFNARQIIRKKNKLGKNLMTSWRNNVLLKDNKKITLTLKHVSNPIYLYQIPGQTADFNRFALRLDVLPKVPQIVWYKEDKPYQLSEYPYTIRWPIQLGEHEFYAKIPYRNERSAKIKLIVR